MPLLDSPRFSFRSASLGEIESALSVIGHVVLDDLWSVPFLKRLETAVAASFAADDERFTGRFDEFPESVIDIYLGGHKGFDAFDTETEAWDAAFFEEVERTGLPALYRRLFGGDFVVCSFERAIRRVDPKFPLRFTGLHHDGQLRLLSSMGLRTERELTVWSPLQDCTDDRIARLLLVERGQNCREYLDAGPQAKVAGIPFNPIQLRPAQFRNADIEAAELRDVHRAYRDLFAALRCYAPLVPLGSAVLFEKDVWHGSYHLPGMTRPRYSLDYRATGDYRVTAQNQHFQGRRFTMEPLPHPTIVEQPSPEKRSPPRFAARWRSSVRRRQRSTG